MSFYKRGDEVKKWCIGICLCCLILWIGKKEKTVPVFDQTDLDEFTVVTINVSNSSMTTKTITSLLDSLTINKVSYEIPKLYQAKFVKENPEYRFVGISNQRGLTEIENIVSRFMKEMGNQREVEKISFYGVKLRSIEVCGSIEKIEELKQKVKNF